jgi:two-component system response regulator YesN
MNLRPLERKAIFEIKTYIEEHFSDAMTLQTLCALPWQNGQVIFRPRRLHDAFILTCLQTIREFHTNLRMQKAKDLLETTDLSIKAIALSVGYKGNNNFSTAFTKHFRVTPSGYRNNMT